MGTDVYLEWQEKGKADDEKQVTGFDIGSGEVGYLRASIHMVLENALLWMLFPEKYWSKGSKDEYDFKGDFEMVQELGLKYLLATATGKQLEVDSRVAKVLEQQQKACGAILGALKAAGCGATGERAQVVVGMNEDFRDAVGWLESVFRFFELGIQKQEQGLKPYPSISW